MFPKFLILKLKLLRGKYKNLFCIIIIILLYKYIIRKQILLELDKIKNLKMLEKTFVLYDYAEQTMVSFKIFFQIINFFF